MTKCIITDTIPKADQMGVLGRNNAISTMAFILGPSIGGHILELDHGFLIICMATTIIFLINSGGFISVEITVIVTQYLSLFISYPYPIDS